MKEILILKHKGCWAEQNKEIKNEMNITDDILKENNYVIKRNLTSSGDSGSPGFLPGLSPNHLGSLAGKRNYQRSEGGKNSTK